MTVVDGTRAIVADWDPFSVAVMVALWAEARLAVEAENIADVELAGTVTEAGTVRELVELASTTEAPLPPGALAKVTVQLACALAPRELGAHCSVEIEGGATNDRETVCDEPFRDAVRCAV